MSYLSFTFLYVFASVLVRVLLQNYHGVAWYEDTFTTQNCLCSSNGTNGSNVYYMNSTQNHVGILPITPNGIYNCSNSKCIDCNWKIHVKYDNPFDVIEITEFGNILNFCPDINCADYSLMITNCQGGMIFNYNSSNDNNIQYIDMATQETPLCIYFNSSESGSVCNYDLFLNSLIINFDYISVKDCGCWQSNELYLNTINETLYLPIDYSENDINCLNVPCVNCTWHINISYADPNDAVLIEYGQDFQSCNSRLIMTNCKNNFPLIDSSSAEIINRNEMEYGQDYSNSFNIQENELCITLNTTDSEANCSYYPTNGNFCWFQLNLVYQPNIATPLSFNELSMNTELPVLIVPDELKGSGNVLSLISNFGILQLWIANNVPDNTSNFSEFVFDAHNLSNVITTYYNTDQLFFINSSTGSFSINPTNIEIQQNDLSLWFYYVFRITEAHFSNCNDTNFINFAFQNATTLIFNATANISGNCLSSILIPYLSPSLSNPLLPTMYISSINYVGPSTVKALSTIYNESYELFEFSEENSTSLENFAIYGNLINFIIPPNGTLQIEYEAWESEINITEYSFEDYGLGIIQSSNYPRNASMQYIPKNIKCTKGMAEITIELQYVEVPDGGYLRIYNQNQSKAYNNGVFTNETIVFNSVEVTLDYFLGADGQTSTGLLLLFEGQYVNIEEKSHTYIWQKAWFWILFGIAILLLFVAVTLVCYCYYHRNVKETTRYFEFMFSVIKQQNQLSTEDVDELKEVSDALFIPKNKLIINIKEPLGTGVCSTVYQGFLHGPSPLIKLTSLIEAQDFQDCDVAVKVALHFGNDEVDQLFREIEAMKILQYNRNVISMLGWRMLNGKPALVFELAEQNLLSYVKMLMSIDVKEIAFKTILSILWQIAKGMEFIASKDIVHRDLAARNVLLTNDFQAKISDFGLAIINNTSIKESALPKRLPVRWLSIEAIVEKLFSEKSDVWAFGVLMYEVFSMGQDPYAGIPTEGILTFLRSGERMNRPRLATNEMYELMCRCWKENMETRPKFEELVPKLHGLLNDEAGCSKYYAELVLLPENEERGLLNDNNSVTLEILDEEL